MLQAQKFYIVANTMIAEFMSGGTRNIVELVKRLRRLNIPTVIICSSSGKKFYESLNISAKFHITSDVDQRYGLLISYIWNSFKSIINPPEILEGSIIYSESDFLPNTLPAVWMIRRGKGCKWVCCIRAIAPRGFGFRDGRWWKDVLYNVSQEITIQLIKHFGDLAFVVNNEIKDLLLRRGVEERRIAIIDNGVDLDLVNSIQITTQRYDACFMGRLMPHKGVIDLVKAWELVCTKKPNAKLAIAGNGEDAYVGRIIEAVKEKNLSSNIELVGYLDGVSGFNMLKTSKIFVLPSYLEGKPLVLIEAMACCLPIVTYQLPYYLEFYGEIPRYVPVSDIQEFCNEILLLLEDSELRSSLGRQGFEFAKNYDWDSVISRNLAHIEDLYE